MVLKEINRSFICVTDVVPHDHTGTTAYTAATSCSRRVRVGRSCYVCQYLLDWGEQDFTPELIATPCSGRTSSGQCSIR